MTGAVAVRGRRQPSAKRQAEIVAKKAEIEQAAESVDREAPDFRVFLARWGDRYNENNLMRLWVQCPGATSLHKYGTWFGMGRKVRAGQKAIMLVHPRTSINPDKITAANPTGKVMHGASWMALFDFSQTEPLDGFEDQAAGADPQPGQPAPAPDPARAAELKRLRNAALDLHPEKPGLNHGYDSHRDPAYQQACERFQAAWKLYEDFKAGDQA